MNVTTAPWVTARLPVTNIRSKVFPAPIAFGAPVLRVGMKIEPAFRPASNLRSSETGVFERFEFVARRVAILRSAATMVQDDVEINFQTVGMGYRDQPKQGVLVAESGADCSFLILASQIVVVEQVVSHAVSA